jgi:hypothetical protein
VTGVLVLPTLYTLFHRGKTTRIRGQGCRNIIAEKDQFLSMGVWRGSFADGMLEDRIKSEVFFALKMEFRQLCWK